MCSSRFLRLSVLLVCFTLITGCGSSGQAAMPVEPAWTSSSPTPVPPTVTMEASSTTTAQPTATTTATSTPTQAPATATLEPMTESAVLVGAGDISICGQEGDDQTAALLAEIPGTIFTAGDNSNEAGLRPEFINCFGPSWGTMLDRIRPSAGNHEYYTGNADAYFDYFGEAAGPRDKGYYSYDLGAWHIIALNSNCLAAGCSFESEQVAWLEEDLAQNDALCTLAYFHHPRWSSGLEGSNAWLTAFWNTLYEGGVEVVVNGHEHHYERFAPQDTEGNLDEARGIRQFVVGTGGVNHLPFGETQPNSEVRSHEAFGVIKFTLHAESYDWEFIPVEGETFTDSGSGVCHP